MEKDIETSRYTFELESDRLLLRSISESDVDSIFKNFTKQIATYMFPQPTGRIDDTKSFIQKSIAGNIAGTNMQLVIMDKASGEFLGCVGLHHIDKKDPEFGIWLKKEAHGNKYGVEAIAALKEWADDNLDYDYIRYPVVKENIASRKIAETVGGEPKREFMAKNANGDVMDEVEYWMYKTSKE